jgi:mRNA-degrading endonuclease RelE of RelBE toxin-antitoxin system
VRFVETPIFTRALRDTLSDDEYRALQWSLVLRPAQGKLIRGSGGLRKVRWRSGGRGKRGGVRVIYYWDALAETIYMLLIYAKTKQEDLTPEQLKMLSKLVREELK